MYIILWGLEWSLGFFEIRVEYIFIVKEVGFFGVICGFREGFRYIWFWGISCDY